MSMHDSEREALGSTIGADGLALLDAIYDPTAPQWLRQIPGVETLRQIWVQQFYAPEPDVRSALRQSRYIGLKKTHLMQVFIACALNLVRLDAWLNGIPLAKTCRF